MFERNVQLSSSGWKSSFKVLINIYQSTLTHNSENGILQDLYILSHVCIVHCVVTGQ
jgi:hypothetical protein